MREDNLKYISHLDILRTFERAIRRSNLPIEYTQGFNPRQKISFALPLAVGIVSHSEYGEIILKRNISPVEIKDKINQYFPKGMYIKEVVKVNFNIPNLMSKISRADYSVDFKSGIAGIDSDKLSNFLNQPKISYVKKTKNKEREIDLKEFIYRAEINQSNRNEMNLTLKSGSSGHLKPADFLKALGWLENGFKITRSEMYIDVRGKALTPFQYASVTGTYKEN